MNNNPIEDLGQKSDKGVEPTPIIINMHERKNSTGHNSKKLFRGRLPVPNKITLIVLAAMLIVLAAVLMPTITSQGNKGTILTTTQLEKVVSISKLSTAQFIYNGIADKYDESGEEAYHVYYEATVNAGIDMTLVTFEVNDEKKTVTPILPEITVDDPVIDDSSIDYLPPNPNVDLKEVISLCKTDASTEIQQTGQIYQTAKENLKTTVEALLDPILKNEGYTIDWKADNEQTGFESEGEANENSN